jgi:hypothetical protein
LSEEVFGNDARSGVGLDGEPVGEGKEDRGQVVGCEHRGQAERRSLLFDGGGEGAALRVAAGGEALAELGVAQCPLP